MCASHVNLRKEKREMSDYFRHYGYIEPGKQIRYSCNKGGMGTCEPVGMIVLDAWMPCPPGHVSNGWTFDFPVRYVEVPGASVERVVHEGDQAVVNLLIEAAKGLEKDGCRLIFADCGYFGRYQKEVAAAVEIPVYMSSVIQVPWITVSLKSDQSLGLICAYGPGLTYDLFEACGVSKQNFERCVIVGASAECPEFNKLTQEEAGEFDGEKVRDELVQLAVKTKKEHPEIGAFLMECTDIPPYTAAIQEAVNLPIFDATTMVKFLCNTVTQRHYGGFI